MSANRNARPHTGRTTRAFGRFHGETKKFQDVSKVSRRRPRFLSLGAGMPNSFVRHQRATLLIPSRRAASFLTRRHPSRTATNSLRSRSGASQALTCSQRNDHRPASLLPGELSHQLLSEKQYVAATLPQWGKNEWDHLEAVEQVFPETGGADGELELQVGSRDDAHGQPGAIDTAGRPAFPLPEELRLARVARKA